MNIRVITRGSEACLRLPAVLPQATEKEEAMAAKREAAAAEEARHYEILVLNGLGFGIENIIGVSTVEIMDETLTMMS